MPVKVRCPGCSKVLNAPDAARGKAIKCPGCETKVRVPAARTKKAASRKAAPDDDNFLANLDLSKAEDRSVRVCPRCGTEVEQEDIECPSCGIDLMTGALSKETIRKRNVRGPDPALFYGRVWGDSWQFIKDNKSLGFRTTMYWFALLVIGQICFGLAGYFLPRDVPPVVLFFGAIGLFATLAIYGWILALWQKVLEVTMEKKNLLKRIHFDVFLAIALGIKFYFWIFINALQFAIVGSLIIVPLAMSSQSAGALGVIGVYLVSFLMFPMAVAHLSMPVQYKAWASWIMLRLTFKNIKPILYWWMMAIAVGILSLIGLFLMGAIWAMTAASVVQALGIAVKENVLPGGGRELGKVVAILIVVGLVLLLVAQLAIQSFCLLFLMRAHALMTYYNSSRFALIAREKERKYVPRPIGAEGESSMGQMVMLAFLFGCVGIAGGIGYSFMGEGMPFMRGLALGLIGAGGLINLIGGLMLISVAFRESALWGLAVWLVPFAGLVFLVKFWDESKHAFFLSLMGVPFTGAGWAILIFAVAEAVQEAAPAAGAAGAG